MSNLKSVKKALGYDGYEDIQDNGKYVVLTEEYFECLISLIRSCENSYVGEIAKPLKAEFDDFKLRN